MNWHKIRVRDSVGNEFDITGPPDYIEKIQNDQEFADEQIQILSDKRMAFNLIRNVNVCTTPSLESHNNASDELFEETNEDYGSGWLEAPTKLLISLYSEYNPRVRKTVKLKTKKKMWDLIKTKMDEHGYKFTATQIENKWKTLERAYKRKTENNKKNGRSRATCPYEKELEACLAERSSVFPDYLLNADDNGKTRKEIMEAAGIAESSTNNTDEMQSVTAMNDNVTSKSKRDKPLSKELKEYRLAKERHHADHMEIKRRKLDAYIERTQEIAKKNKLFEDFLKKIS